MPKSSNWVYKASFATSSLKKDFLVMYTLKQSRKILEIGYSWYKKKKHAIPEDCYAAFEADLRACDNAYLQGDRETASLMASKIEEFVNENFKKSFLDHAKDILFSLLCAMLIAIVVNQMWFQHMEIPSGSMRPTFMEKDHLGVSKMQFGLNIPLITDHFYFDPDLIKRTGIVIWTGDGIPVLNPDDTFLGIIPTKKRYVKRLIGKPGDSLYFYGGKIYGVDKDGNPIEELLTGRGMEKLEHIPFLTFDGEYTIPKPGVIQIEQMHQPVGRLRNNGNGDIEGEVFNGKEWVADQMSMQNKPHHEIKTYTDFMGMRNFGMARLVTKNELRQFRELDDKDLQEGTLYLQILHHPSLTYPKPGLNEDILNFTNILTPFTSVIPLNERHLKAIMDNMYTSRFEVLGGLGYRYSKDEKKNKNQAPAFIGIPDGMYEFYYGKASKVGWSGVTSPLPDNHPLYSLDPINVQSLFNMGIDMHTYFEPTPGNKKHYPHRYAYFRDGDLYLMGAPILKKDDPTLQAFLSNELKRESKAVKNRPYIPFKDYGPPLKDGKYDVDFIRTFGIQVPAKHYLVLGDNHAMSADSRVFGFIPEENLQGVPDTIVWPYGSRWGAPDQITYPTWTKPRMIIWFIAACLAIGYAIIRRRQLHRSVFLE